MNPEAHQPTTLRGTLFITRILHGALAASIGIYGVVLHVIGEGIAPEDASAPLFYALAVAAAVTAVAIPLLRRSLMPPRRAGMDPIEEPFGEAAREALGKCFVAQIVSWALCEAIAIYGLVLAMLSGDLQAFYVFAGPALLFMIFLAPRRALYEEIARAAQSK